MRAVLIHITSWLVCINIITTTACNYQQAIIVRPVIDLIGLSFCKEYNIQDSTKYYKDIPVCAKSGRYGCARLHQLLYNEQVTILESFEDEIRVEISHLFFQTAQDDTQHIGYWTHKSNVVPLSALTLKNVDLTTLPNPISFVAHTKNTQDIVTLLEPSYDPITNRMYSAGTRFVRAHNTWINKNHIAVHALMPRTLEPVIIGLPKKDILKKVPISPKEQQALFVSIVKKWAHLNNGFIPYTWGGCSFSHECSGLNYDIKNRKIPHGISEYYVWPNLKGTPYSGFDCAGIIARATQLAGMPYFYKNTTTLARNMQSLSVGETIEAGDLLWFPGHVMIVSDANKNLTIEARGYDSGFGKIHELPLKKVFAGIETYKQLSDALFNKIPLKRLNDQGVVFQTLSTFKILKMSSIWPDYTYHLKK